MVGLGGFVGLVTAIAGVVLAAAGAVKLVDPGPTALVIERLGVGGGRWSARGLGAVELAVALWLLLGGGVPAALTAGLAYVVFAATVVVLRRRQPDTPCGCFGQWSGPPTVRHVAITATGALVCVLAALTATTLAPPPEATATVVALWWTAVGFGALGVVWALTGSQPLRRAAPRRRHSTPQGGS